MKKYFLIFFVFFLVSILGYSLISSSINSKDDSLINKVSLILPASFKSTLKNTLFAPKQIKVLEKDIKKQSIEIDLLKNLKKQNELNQFKVYSNNDILIDLVSYDENLIINKHDFTIKKIPFNFLAFSKSYPNGYSNSYLDLYNSKLIIGSGNGVFGFIDFNNIISTNYQYISIPSNIDDFIDNQFVTSDFEGGLKDIHIVDETLYVSLVLEVSEMCYGIKVIQAKVNTKFLNFESFFDPIECVKSDEITNEPTMLVQSGGRIISDKNGNIILSTGDFRNRSKSQNEKSIFGKLILLKKGTNSFKILTMGNRNIQGMTFDAKSEFILMTEHGPKGGDEINYYNFNFSSKIENYGWPISSYGEHYKNKKIIYENYPLHKSHEKFGFNEPIIYFTPSIAISEIEHIDQNLFIFSSMGTNSEEGDLSLYKLIFDKKIIEYEKLFSLGRIRDLRFDKKNNVLFIFNESAPEIIMISDFLKIFIN